MLTSVLRLTTLLVCGLGIPACGSEGDSAPAATQGGTEAGQDAALDSTFDGGTGDGPSDEIATDPPDAGGNEDASPDVLKSPCEAQDEAIGSALKQIPYPDRNLLLVIKNPECGTKEYLRGSSSYAAIDSLWRVGSITKTFVSAAVLSLVKEGKLSLDTPLSQWEPNVPYATEITVQMLLAHRSGIYNYTEDPSIDPAQPVTPQQLVDAATAHAPHFLPGAKFEYSNTNYVLLGMILEASTGQKAGAVLHARAIDTAGLLDTFLDGEDVFDKDRLALGLSGGGVDHTFHSDPSYSWTAGGMVATGRDLASWVEKLYGTDDILDAQQRAKLTETTSVIPWPGFFNGSLYGLGVILLDASKNPNAGQGMGHAGLIFGYYGHSFYYSSKKTSIVSIANSDFGPADEAFVAALGVLFPGPADAGADAP